MYKFLIESVITGLFSPLILQGEDCCFLYFMVCFSAHEAPFWAKVYSKRTECVPHGSTFFDLFSGEGRQNDFDGVAPTERVTIHMKT